jgi:hypothetical protein
MKTKLCAWKAYALSQIFASTQDGSLAYSKFFNKMEIFIYGALSPFK